MYIILYRYIISSPAGSTLFLSVSFVESNLTAAYSILERLSFLNSFSFQIQYMHGRIALVCLLYLEKILFVCYY